MSKNGSTKVVAALSKRYIENPSGQEVGEKDVVADKKQQKIILTMCLIKKDLNAKAVRKSSCESKLLECFTR